ncbi:MAG: GDSL-type esterase/lipase family protein [Tannerellaceae bacterium]|nr:GDSL-type esterase/lipase family protein [Tannerellaceae bacterium]
MNRKRFTAILRALALVVIGFGCVSARIWADDKAAAFGFAVDSLCAVSDPHGAMAGFYRELSDLEAGKDTVINIVHIGDSHIQAGFLSGSAMRLLQDRYGNAGRGWIAPLRISRTNEPDDYFIRSLVKEWTVGRCIQPRPRCDFGLGGTGLLTESPFVNFDLIITPVNGLGFSYNQVVAYRGEKSTPLLPGGLLRDSSTVKTAGHPLLRMATDTIRLPYAVDSLQLQSTRRKPGSDSLLPDASFRNLYFGFSLSNGRPGLLYHAIGTNGATFAHYAQEQFIRRIASLRPSLLIVSLGTNDSFGRGFNTAEFERNVGAFLDLVEKYMPGAAVMLVTPPECYRRTVVNKKRTYIRNERIELVAKSLVDIAAERRLACWDFFAATGGRNSHKAWFAGGWMSRDRIHFSKEAYYRQGSMLYRAITAPAFAPDSLYLP